ncbi:MAG TPA: DUF3566 domain-containing protein [Streptosporangiaceae bacterium]|nr:DUF3566 domain-containing protein [Streptosporangiaceae bacterium]
MDHRAEPPSWRSGAAPASAQGSQVASGVGPPSEDQGEDGQGQAHDDGDQGYARDSTGGYAGSDQSPGFSDAGQGAPPPSFSDSPSEFGSPFASAYGGSAAQDGHHAGMPDTSEVHQGGASGQYGAAPGFGDVPGGYYGEALAAPGPDSYGGSAPSFSGQAPADPGFGAYPAGTHDYSGGTSTSFDDGQIGGPYGNSTAYGGDPSARMAAAEPGLSYSQPYSARPVQAARAKMTASLKAAKRPKAPKRSARSTRPGRQAQLTVARVEPWSVMKFSFVISLVAFIVLFVAVAVLYGVLSGLGVFDALQRTVSSITSSQSSSGFNIQSWLSASRVLGYTGLLGAINVVLITALSTVGSVLYNITADLAGGVEVTLKETE